MFFVEHCVVKQNIALAIKLDLMANLLPDLSGCKAAGFEEVLHVIVCYTLQVVSQIGGGIVNLAAE